MNIKKNLIIIVLAIVVSGLVFLFFLFPNSDDLTSYEVIPIIQSNRKVYIKKKVWGISGDHQVIVISNSDKKDFKIDSTKDYVFHGSTPLFFKQKNDSLIVYTMRMALVPTNFKNSFQIIQIELSNAEMIRLIEKDTYKNEGLQAISE